MIHEYQSIYTYHVFLSIGVIMCMSRVSSIECKNKINKNITVLLRYLEIFRNNNFFKNKKCKYETNRLLCNFSL